jgi:hypothetical protein
MACLGAGDTSLPVEVALGLERVLGEAEALSGPAVNDLGLDDASPV